LEVNAAHAGSSVTKATGDTTSGDTGVGISLALTIATDSALATTERNINAGGAVKFASRMTSPNEARAKASVAGGDSNKDSDSNKAKDGKDQGGGVNNQVHNQTNTADQRATSSGADKGTTGQTDGKKSDSSSGPVQVAGAAGVTVAITHSQALVPAGVTITSAKSVTVQSDNNTDAVATGDGAATTSKDGTGVGIGVAVSFAEITNTATVDDGATIVSNGLTVGAGVADRAVSISSATIDVVDYKADTIFVGMDHGLKTGDKVEYTKGTGDVAIGKLETGKEYYVIDAGDGRIKLAAEEADARSGKAIDITAPEEGKNIGEDHKLKPVTELELSFDTLMNLINPPPTIVFDPAAKHDVVDLGKSHGLNTGDEVVFQGSKDGAGNISGLANGEKYYVIRLDGNRAELAATREDAFAGKAIDIDEGKGKDQKLVDSVSSFRADAKSGASGGDTGVAGSVAVNIALLHNEAVVRDGATVTLNGGDLDLKAASVTTSVASATPRGAVAASGEDLGVGASFAVNIEIAHTRAEVEDGATLTTATGKSLGHATVDVDSHHIIETEARTGAASSKGNAIGGAVAVTFGEHHTTARLGDDVNIKLIGALDVSAEHETDMKATVDSASSGKNASIGVSVAVAIGLDTTNASVGGTVDAGGTATVLANHRSASATMANASAKGADSEDSKDDEKTAPSQFDSASADLDADTLKLTGSELKTGDEVIYRKGEGDTAIGGLEEGKHYFVHADGDQFKLYDTEEHANAGKTGEGSGLKDITSAGSGSSHSLTKQIPLTADDHSKKEVDFTTKLAGSDQAKATSAPSANGEIDQGNKDATDKGTSKDTKSETKSGEGSKIKVAAAIGVTVLDSRSTAEVEDSAKITAGGAVKISSTSEVDASTKAIGLSISQSDSESKEGEGGGDTGGDSGGGDTGGKSDTTGVAAGVSVNVGVVHNTASVGELAEIVGNGITVEAVTPASESNDIIAWGIAGAGAQQKGSSGSSTAVAGGVGVNVFDIHTDAQVADTADLQSTGAIDVIARSEVGVQNIAAAGAAAIGGSQGSGQGVGAAVAVNVILNNTTARIGENDGNLIGPDVDAAGAISVKAEAATNPLVLIMPPIVFNATDESVNKVQDTVTIDQPQLKTGDEVIYHQGREGNVAIGNVTDGAHYFVRVEGNTATTIALYDTKEHAEAGGSTFDANTGVVNVAQDTITPLTTALNPPPFETGDEVIYRKGAAENTPITGLTDGTRYFARVEADGGNKKISLYDTKAHAEAGAATFDASGTSVNRDNETISIGSATFATGDEVIYRKGTATNTE